MDFNEWKKQVIEYLREVERKASVTEGAWNFLIGDEETMREEYDSGWYADDPIGYVDYQIECAQ